MKNYLIISAAALLMTACNQKELADSNRDKDSLIAILNERDSTINDFISSFNDVESGFAAIKEKQNIISINSDKPGELKMTQKARINSEIAEINTLMDQNRKTIADLNSRIRNSTNKNSKLVKMVESLNEQLISKAAELAELNTRLTDLNAQVTQLQTNVDTLFAQNTMQSQIIADETAALHTAYYVVGKSNDLQDANIIDRKGGLLGIGKTAKIKGDFDNSKFTQIDYTLTSNIPVNSDIKIITSHPSDSYTLDKEDADKDHVKNIVITNPEKFWSVSKYLVVIKD